MMKMENRQFDDFSKAITILCGVLTLIGAVAGGAWGLSSHSTRLAVLEEKHAALEGKAETLRVSHDKLIVSVVKMSTLSGVSTKEIETPEVVEIERKPGSKDKPTVADPHFTLPGESQRNVASAESPKTIDSVKVESQIDGSIVLKASKGRVLKARKLKDGSLQIFSKSEL